MNQQTIKGRADRRADSRDAMIRRLGKELGAALRDSQQRLIGLLAGEGHRFPMVMSAVDQLLRETIPAMQRVMLAGLTRLALWSWDSAADNWVRGVPLRVWMVRSLLPWGKLQESAITEKLGDRYEPNEKRKKYGRLARGEISRTDGLRLAKELEFPPPGRQVIRRIVDATSARDGLSAMERIKTVCGADLGRLRQTIISGLSAVEDPNQASNLENLVKNIKSFFADDESMGYKARRIARTESIRVAEAMQRESNERVADLYTGVQFLRSGGKPCDECDPWDKTVFWRDDAGQFVAEDGRLLPDIPVHPNCLCYTVPELRPDIEAQLPPVDLGAWHEPALQIHRAAIAAD
jgi:hypothetical protein